MSSCPRQKCVLKPQKTSSSWSSATAREVGQKKHKKVFFSGRIWLFFYGSYPFFFQFLNKSISVFLLNRFAHTVYQILDQNVVIRHPGVKMSSMLKRRCKYRVSFFWLNAWMHIKKYSLVLFIWQSPKLVFLRVPTNTLIVFCIFYLSVSEYSGCICASAAKRFRNIFWTGSARQRGQILRS